MEENTGPSPEVSPQFIDRDLETSVRLLIDSLRRSDTLRSLGFTDNVVEVARSVLCALWRNTPLRELDVLRGILPAGIDLMFASCDRPHRRHVQPVILVGDALVDDVAEHLGIPSDQALAATRSVIDVLRGFVGDLDHTCLLLESPDLKALLRCPP